MISHVFALDWWCFCGVTQTGGNLFFFIPGLMQLLGMRWLQHACLQLWQPEYSPLLVRGTLSPTAMFTPGRRISYQVRHCTATQTQWARRFHRTAEEWCLIYGRHHISALCLSSLQDLYIPWFWQRKCSSLQPAVVHFFLFWSQTSSNAKVPAACKTWERGRGEWQPTAISPSLFQAERWKVTSPSYAVAIR